MSLDPIPSIHPQLESIDFVNAAAILTGYWITYKRRRRDLKRPSKSSIVVSLV
jgi:hypothetical protein